MKKFKIKTGNKERLVYMPSFEERVILERRLIALNDLVLSDPRSKNVHGFIPDRNPITNAKPHIGYLYTISLDLKNFFESITRDKVQGLVPDSWLDELIIDGCARQGLPTSPQVANLAFLKYDEEFSKLGSYTRYADDLTYSCDDYDKCLTFKSEVERVLSGYFAINERKTKIQYSFPDFRRRRIITGVSVGYDDVRPTRKLKRKIRAAHFKINKTKTKKSRRRFCGLAGWENFIRRENDE